MSGFEMGITIHSPSGGARNCRRRCRTPPRRRSTTRVPDAAAAKTGPSGSTRRRPAGAHPPQPSRRVPRDERVVGDVAGDDGPRTDRRKPSDVVAGDDHRPRADRGAGLQADRAHHPVVGPRELAVRGDRAREPVVGEDRVRPDEHTVLNGHAVVDERGVLDLHPVADDDALVDERVTTNRRTRRRCGRRDGPGHGSRCSSGGRRTRQAPGPLSGARARSRRSCVPGPLDALLGRTEACATTIAGGRAAPTIVDPGTGAATHHLHAQ